MDELKLRLERAHSIRRHIYGLLHRKEYADETKNVLLMTYTDIALEHHESILLLIDKKLSGSAFALFRPLFETTTRALWVNLCAHASQIDEIATKDDFQFPAMKDMVDAIDTAYATDGFFAEIKRRAWTAMNSYTHSGLLPVGRRFTDRAVKPSYREGEVNEVIDASTSTIMLLARAFFVSMLCPDEAAETEKMMFQFSQPNR